jgi:sulfatase maturation enzyme AslB (radical SAM superfamily)
MTDFEMKDKESQFDGICRTGTRFDPGAICLAADSMGGQVYCIPADNTNRGRFPAGIPIREYPDAFPLKNLKTDEPVSFVRDDVSIYPVPDAQLGHLIRLLGIRGIRTPYKIRPVSCDPSEVPLEGNTIDPLWASICVGGTCNNNCIFCFTKWIQGVPDIETTQIKNIIERLARISTIRSLVFTGGEPTIRPDLVSLFVHANQYEFQDIGIQTNGRELKKMHIVDNLAKYGLRRVLLSLHGPDGGVHDTISGIPGSYREAIQGLHNLMQYSIEPVINTVICRANYETLIEIVQSLDPLLHQARRIRFSYPIIEGAAFDHVDDIIVSYPEVSRVLYQAIELANNLEMEIELANMPLCICGPTSTSYDRIKLSECAIASPFYKYNIFRGEKSVKLNSCSQCRKNWLCPGIQIEYLRFFPDAIHDFRPVT